MKRKSFQDLVRPSGEHRPQPRDLTGADVRAMLDAMARELGNPRNGYGGQKPLAEKLGVSESFLSDVLNGRREPTKAILSPLGLERVVTYRRAPASGVRACATCGGSGEVRGWETIHGKRRAVVNNCPDCTSGVQEVGRG